MEILGHDEQVHEVAKVVPPRRTQVGIVGAGPAGLLLSHLLDLAGIDSVVLEARSRNEVEATLRAGVLEQGTVDLLRECGVGERMLREGFVHHGIELLFDGERHRIPFSELTGGRAITVYAQHEVIKDLVKARLDAGGCIVFEAKEVALRDIETPRPRIEFETHQGRQTLECEFVAGCDGFHGVCRPSIPAKARTEYVRHYPFGWFGILVRAAPYAPELVYAHHPLGFSLVSTRSPEVQRLYFQCDPKDDVANWPDDRIWTELDTRLATNDGWNLARGTIFQKGIVAMRSFVLEPMQFGSLFLAGDAAHIVPPTGAKGMNLAVADVCALAGAFIDYYASGQREALHGYSAAALERVWAAEHFSWWMTALLHRYDDGDPFQQRMQRAQLQHVVRSKALQTALAESYVGLPMPGRGTSAEPVRGSERIPAKRLASGA